MPSARTVPEAFEDVGAHVLSEKSRTAPRRDSKPASRGDGRVPEILVPTWEAGAFHKELPVKVLVTGGAGFIGSNLVRSLLARGDAVRVLDDFSTGKRENLAGLEGELEIIEGDIRNEATCSEACRGVEAIFHQAAIGSVPRSIEDPLTTHRVNVDGTLNLLIAAREARVKRFVYASSSSVYGDAPEKAKDESLRPRPLSPYAVSKLAGELYTLVFSRLYGVEGVALRYFNVFGPRQDPSSMYAAVVPKFIAALLDGTRPTIYGDGKQTRDFTYVENVVRANLLALECPSSACGKAYNIACGSAISVNELFRLIRGEIGPQVGRIRPIRAAERPGDVKHSLASIKLAQAELGYVPTVAVEEGIRLTVEWFRAQRPAAQALNGAD